MILEIKKCGACGIRTNKGKYWGTGTWLCDKCHTKWSEKDKKMRESSSDESVSESVIKKIKKGRNTKRRKSKNVKTKLHEDGSQSRLTMFNDEE